LSAFLMTPEQYRQAAHRLRMLAAQPGAFDPAWARRLARNHELIADVISRRGSSISHRRRWRRSRLPLFLTFDN
jgi:hypothetical protein